jgi:hypothetical protein
MRILLLLALAGGSLFGQNIRPIPSKPSPVEGSAAVRGLAKADKSGAVKKAFFEAGDVVFPHLATGDGWETEMTLVNMSLTAVTFDIYFYGTNGSPLTVTIRELPNGPQITNSAFEVDLDSGASTTVVLVDTTPGQLRTGWAILDYDTDDAHIGGHATFRQRIAGRADYEALIPMSNFEDYVFLLPTNDSAGFISAMAICNPANNVTATVEMYLYDTDANELCRATLTLAPQEQRSFALSQYFPQVAGRYGLLFVESTTDRLSAIGLRFNTAGGNSFSSVPIMNWSGLF